jgi:hypothetical protein
MQVALHLLTLIVLDRKDTISYQRVLNLTDGEVA